MIVINLWGAPSSGKSTTAAGLFFLMKINKFKVEMAMEFAKELVLERRENVFGDQNFIFAEQGRRLRRIEDHNYDFAITDSPLLLPLFYDTSIANPHFPSFVMGEFHKHNNLNYFLRRRHTFEPLGRRHNEAESLKIEEDLQRFLNGHDVEFTEVDASPNTPEIILADLRARMAAPVPALPFSNMDDRTLL